MIGDLKKRLDENEYDIVIRLVTFFADLGNSAVLTVDSIVQFLFVFLDNSTEQNVGFLNKTFNTYFKYL